MGKMKMISMVISFMMEIRGEIGLQQDEIESYDEIIL
jgi:hypothetical protein